MNYLENDLFLDEEALDINNAIDFIMSTLDSAVSIQNKVSDMTEITDKETYALSLAVDGLAHSCKIETIQFEAKEGIRQKIENFITSLKVRLKKLFKMLVSKAKEKMGGINSAKKETDSIRSRKKTDETEVNVNDIVVDAVTDSRAVVNTSDLVKYIDIYADVAIVNNRLEYLMKRVQRTVNDLVDVTKKGESVNTYGINEKSFVGSLFENENMNEYEDTVETGVLPGRYKIVFNKASKRTKLIKAKTGDVISAREQDVNVSDIEDVEKALVKAQKDASGNYKKFLKSLDDMEEDIFKMYKDADFGDNVTSYTESFKRTYGSLTTSVNFLMAYVSFAIVLQKNTNKLIDLIYE